MSSATVMFVLKHILDQPASPGNDRICSMAFGPGLTVETALLTRIGAVPADGTAVAVPVAETATDTAAVDAVPSDLEPILSEAGA